jgi:hypothetical protein
MAALALKQFSINQGAQNQEEYLQIVGRRGGLMAFLLSLMKIDPTTQLKCNDERVEVIQSSFFGRQTLSIPITAITGIIGGYRKPKGLLAAMPIVLILGGTMIEPAGSMAPLLAALVIVAIMFVFYILKRELSIYVQNGGDAHWGLSFNRSVIENVPVDIKKVDEAIALVNARILRVLHK